MCQSSPVRDAIRRNPEAPAFLLLAHFKRLFTIGDYVVNVLGTCGDADIVTRYTGGNLFLFIELLMCRAGRVDHQCFAVADVSKMARQFDTVDELNAGLLAAFDTEAKYGALTIGQIFLANA